MEHGAPPTQPPLPTEQTRRLSRRQVLRSGMYGTVGLFMTQALIGSGVMFWPTKVTGFGAKILAPVRLSELRPGDPPVRVREGRFYLSRLEDGIIALYWKCPHLGCTVPWNEAEGQFHCPCHGSIYDRTGQNLGGPAPRPMDYMPIEIEGENIWVDTGTIIQRPRHDPSHVTKV